MLILKIVCICCCYDEAIVRVYQVHLMNIQSGPKNWHHFCMP